MISGTQAKLVLTSVALTLAIGCQTREKPSTRTADITTQSSSQAGPLVSRIPDFMGTRHLQLDTILASNDSVAVIVAKRDSAHVIFTLVWQNGIIAQTRDSIVMGEYALPSVTLGRLADGRLARIITFDDLGENIVGTEVAAVDGISARRLFADTANTCAPAKISYNENGAVTGLVGHSEYPFASDCTSSCAMRIRARMRADPEWADTLALKGNDFSVVKSAKHFYSDRAKTYREMASALSDGRLDACVEEASKLRGTLAGWERRAADLASPSK